MEKASEISMLIDNKLLSAILNTKGIESSSVDSPDSIPLNNNSNVYNPPTNTENEKIQDIFRVVHTKSTILGTIYNRIMEEETNLKDAKSGNLIRVKDVSLSVENLQEVQGIKALLGGMSMKISGNEDMSLDLMSFLRVLFKDAAYILSGELEDDLILLKIPMSTQHEMESRYSISDIEIGKVTILGIYRGKYPKQDIKNKINSIMAVQDTNLQNVEEKSEKEVHYIDVIAIVQDLSLE